MMGDDPPNILWYSVKRKRTIENSTPILHTKTQENPQGGHLRSSGLGMSTSTPALVLWSSTSMELRVSSSNVVANTWEGKANWWNPPPGPTRGAKQKKNDGASQLFPLFKTKVINDTGSGTQKTWLGEVKTMVPATSHPPQVIWGGYQALWYKVKTGVAQS